MARTTQNTASVASTVAAVEAPPTREQFVREYMQQLSANRPPKASLTDKLVGWAEDRAVNAVKNSRRSFGRFSAAWEIAEQIQDQAYAEEHAKHAEEMARRLGLV